MTQQEQRQQLFDTMEIKNQIVKNDTIIIEDVNKSADQIVAKILTHKDAYESIAHKFPNPGLKMKKEKPISKIRLVIRKAEFKKVTSYA